MMRHVLGALRFRLIHHCDAGFLSSTFRIQGGQQEILDGQMATRLA
jgi:hypothetical protein